MYGNIHTTKGEQPQENKEEQKMNEKIECAKQSTGWKIDTQREEQKEVLENIRDLAERMLKNLENGSSLYETSSIMAYAQRLERASQKLEGLNERMQMLEFLQK